MRGANPADEVAHRRRVGAVVVAYDSAATIGRCLQSLQRHEPTLPVVVVDNASPSGPPDELGTAALLCSPTNTGFGGGCNLGAEHQSVRDCEFLIFLNPDVELTGPSITQLADRLQEKPGAGAATGHVIDASGKRVPTGWGEVSMLRTLWAFAGLRLFRTREMAGRMVTGGPFTSAATMTRDELEVDGFLLGGVLMVRKAAFQQINGFDENFFMSWDDVDLGRRLRTAGWELWVVPTDPIRHVGRGSGGDVSAHQRREWYRAGLTRYADKHLPPLRARLLKLLARIPPVSMRPFESRDPV